jgi:antitoxin FitA
VWERFKADPEQIAWYYQSLRDVFTEAGGLPRRAVREFVEVVDELTTAAWAGVEHPDPEASLARIRDRKERTGSRLSAEQILEHRDVDRR